MRFMTATAIGTLCLGLGGAPAMADVIFTFGKSNLTGIGPGPYGSMDLHLNSPTSATFTFMDNSIPGFTYDFTEMGLNLLDTHVTAGPVTFTKAPGDTKTPSFSIGSGNLDGFGNFVFKEIANPNGASDEMTEAAFTLTLNDGTTWANQDKVLDEVSSPPPYAAGVHLIENGGINTGYAVDTTFCDTGTAPGDCGVVTTHDAPEPGPLGLLLLGSLVTMGGWYYRRAV